MNVQTTNSTSPEIARILQARHHDPFSLLGKHPWANGEIVRAHLPHARNVRIEEVNLTLERVGKTGLFQWQGEKGLIPDRYHFVWHDEQDNIHRHVDPYCFPPQLSDYDIHLFNSGKHWHVYRTLGAHPHVCDGIQGVLFATWAPNAERVSIVGDFNRWDGRCHPMRVRGHSGVWELFIPGLDVGAKYKFEIRHRDSGTIHLKSDPYGQRFEVRPGTD